MARIAGGRRAMPEQRVEYRVAGYWVERCTVTVSEWETVEDGGGDVADLIERTAKENT